MPDYPEGFLERAEEIHPGSISRQEFEEILQLGSEFIAMDGEYRIFILGNYGMVKRNRLEEVEKTIRTYPGASCNPFRMSDLLEGDAALNGILKYRLLADYSTNIIVICEDNEGGVVLEQGMLAVLPEHLKKSYLCKRTYPDDLERQRYSWMQPKGVFDIYEDLGRLLTWRKPDDLIEEVEGILDQLG